MRPFLWVLACGAPPERADADAATSAALGDCVPVPLYEDEDGDGFGVYPGPPTGYTGAVDLVCRGTPGWTDRAGDCDDADPAVHLGAADVCGDAVDHDCVEGCAPVERVGIAEAVVLGHREHLQLGAELDAGDLDGDGVAELVAVASSYGGGPVDVYDRNGALLASWSLGAANVRVVGDLDGDGVAEIAAGAPRLRYCDPACDYHTYGGVWLIEGPGYVPGYGPEIRGGGEDDEIGDAVSAGGDLDADGGIDLLVGAPGKGEAFAWQAGGLVSRLKGGSSRFGFVVQGDEDVDGDGVDDALVASGAGVHVFYGPLRGEMLESDADVVARAARDIWEGDMALADVDGDGHTDFASPPEWVASGASVVRVFTGPFVAHLGPEAASATLTMPADVNHLRAAAGDHDGDGTGDLVLADEQGGPALRGVVYLVLGPVQGARTPMDDADRRWVGDAPGASLGASVVLADVDGDGGAEIVAGALGPEPGWSGAVYLLDGEP